MLTISLFAKKSVCVLQCSGLPPLGRKVIVEELEHHALLSVSWSLSPQSVYDLLLAQGEEDQGHRGRVTFLLCHETVASYSFELISLGCQYA